MPTTDPKQVLVEILRNAPDGINKTKLYKSFYLAHLVYADKSPGFLTNWPITHMPQGPGISDSYELLDALEAEGYLEREFTTNGLYKESVFRWTGKPLPDDKTPDDLKMDDDEIVDAMLEPSFWSHQQRASTRVFERVFDQCAHKGSSIARPGKKSKLFPTG